MGTWKVKFPCGLEIEEEGFGIGLKNWNKEGMLNKIEEKGCLIHGKDCKIKKL